MQLLSCHVFSWITFRKQSFSAFKKHDSLSTLKIPQNPQKNTYEGVFFYATFHILTKKTRPQVYFSKLYEFSQINYSIECR